MSQTHSRTDSENAYGIPRWVKLFAIIALILIVLLGILHFSGGHGPGSHMTSGEMGSATIPASMMSENTPPSEKGG